MTKKGIPDKCKRCATFSAEQAQELHGGDCWDPTVCYSRRSYARHRDRINLVRSRKRVTSHPELVVNVDEFAGIFWAVLLVYRPVGTDTPVHAIAVQVWKGQERLAAIKPIHCIGMTASQVHTYVQKVLNLLESNYGIKKFVSQERLDPWLCPLRPCPCHSHE
ncbi:hypothetical protein [Pseudanabaena mucicola]|uniref:Uncharacterized protein n=1 Tax=Pseudanabaena mucicola FACHB-723 TaxID=2692860 RepID=A0ABR7ZZQ0_9CYAN|nr:hypothetical protein [Pseudanabaena mucicola]MBD2189349.1 hypothetical protein [Pseudanabaena mucicola FACHB-723]